jgi:hypothetical protein
VVGKGGGGGKGGEMTQTFYALMNKIKNTYFSKKYFSNVNRTQIFL